MARAVALAMVLGALLLVGGVALAQEADQWPPPEMTVQPRPEPSGPMPVDPSTLEGRRLDSSPAESTAPGWSLLEYASAAGALLAAFAGGLGGGMGAYHVTCRKGALELGAGGGIPANLPDLVDRLERAVTALEAIQRASPPARSRRSASRTLEPPLGPEDPP